MKRAWAPLVLGVLAACRGGDALDPAVLGFKVEPPTVVFGRVLEGDERSLAVTITSLTRVDQELELLTDAPFSAPATVQVPGGATVDAPVTFRAGGTRVEGLLRVIDESGDDYLYPDRLFVAIDLPPAAAVAVAAAG